jgi:hypothetical protein
MKNAIYNSKLVPISPKPSPEKRKSYWKETERQMEKGAGSRGTNKDSERTMNPFIT